MKGGSKVVVQPHRHDGIFIAKGKEDALVTKNLVPGEAVYNEKRITVQVPFLSHHYFCFSFLVGTEPCMHELIVSFCRTKMVPKMSTEFGILFHPSWLLPSLVELTTYGL